MNEHGHLPQIEALVTCEERTSELEAALVSIETISVKHPPNTDYARITDLVRRARPT